MLKNIENTNLFCGSTLGHSVPDIRECLIRARKLSTIIIATNRKSACKPVVSHRLKEVLIISMASCLVGPRRLSKSEHFQKPSLPT